MVDLRLWQMLSLGCGTLFWLAMGVWILKGMAYGDACFEVDENDPLLKTYHRYFLMTGISGAICLLVSISIFIYRIIIKL